MLLRKSSACKAYYGVYRSELTIFDQIDKATLGQAALLGIREDTNLSKIQYNNLNTLFYAGT